MRFSLTLRLADAVRGLSAVQGRRTVGDGVRSAASLPVSEPRRSHRGGWAENRGKTGLQTEHKKHYQTFEGACKQPLIASIDAAAR